MKNKLIVLLLALIAPLVLTGCQLARADGALTDAGQGDRLIGVAVTTEYLDLFDFERYVNDHSSAFVRGGEVSIDDTDGYNGRIYATLRSELLTSDETGETLHDWEYVFDGLDAMTLFCAYIEQPDSRNTFWGMSSTGEISDASLALGDGITLEGTLYVLAAHHNAFYINPVYQRADGQVYLTAGSGYSASGNTSEGSVYTQTLEQTETVTENGETTERSDKITLHIAVKYPTVRLRVTEMDGRNNPLAQREYPVAQLPEHIAVSADAAYLIVEQTVKTSDGTQVRRTLLTREDNWIQVYTARDDGICIAQSVALEWA